MDLRPASRCVLLVLPILSSLSTLLLVSQHYSHYVFQQSRHPGLTTASPAPGHIRPRVRHPYKLRRRTEKCAVMVRDMACDSQPTDIHTYSATSCECQKSLCWPRRHFSVRHLRMSKVSAGSSISALIARPSSLSGLNLTISYAPGLRHFNSSLVLSQPAVSFYINYSPSSCGRQSVGYVPLCVLALAILSYSHNPTGCVHVSAAFARVRPDRIAHVPADSRRVFARPCSVQATHSPGRKPKRRSAIQAEGQRQYLEDESRYQVRTSRILCTYLDPRAATHPRVCRVLTSYQVRTVFTSHHALTQHLQRCCRPSACPGVVTLKCAQVR